MRATGIVRRVDDLGRVVIPKEIRKNLGIREGEPLEIFIERDGGVMFRKYEYNLLDELDKVADLIDTHLNTDKTIQSQINHLLGTVRTIIEKEIQEEE